MNLIDQFVSCLCEIKRLDLRDSVAHAIRVVERLLLRSTMEIHHATNHAGENSLEFALVFIADGIKLIGGHAQQSDAHFVEATDPDLTRIVSNVGGENVTPYRCRIAPVTLFTAPTVAFFDDLFVAILALSLIHI